ncbi:DsbA family protein [Flexibacterium corallicola]|uniref:DsbA family protein n=1 Tax=Flexibacterium corallicola TaxID=3037259 RepID=UPI00286ED272|nr:DsbA family protein [Pseudovibrio sp. M1P-2-3]
MNKHVRNVLSGCAVMLLLPSISAGAAETAPDKEAVEKIVREYLLENPQVIAEALTVLEEQRVAQEEQARKTAMSQVSELLFNSENQVTLGNPDGDVTLVEFFDYNCGYCKRALGDTFRLIEEDKNLRVVLKEFPVLGQPSVEAATVAIALNQIAPEKYEEFHSLMLSSRGRANKQSALDTAKSIGVDTVRLQEAIDAGVAQATLQEVYSIAGTLGLTGTPSYAIGDEVVVGAVGYDTLKKKIEAERQ